MGEEPKLGLSGRPKRPIGALGSSQVYRIMGRTVVAYPLVFDVNDFYISSDANSLINNVWFTLDFISRHFHFQQVYYFIFFMKLDDVFFLNGPFIKFNEYRDFFLKWNLFKVQRLIKKFDVGIESEMRMKIQTA